MKSGHLSEYFLGVAAKTLAATEVDPETSRGHEYQGVDAFQQFLGTPSEKQKIGATYVRLSDDEAPLKLESSGTWYNSRKNQAHRSPEYRLYYPSEANRIEEKHLVTLEPGISKNQTDEMSTKKLRLVLPGKLHETYQASQQSWLMKLDEFISLVKEREGT